MLIGLSRGVWRIILLLFVLNADAVVASTKGMMISGRRFADEVERQIDLAQISPRVQIDRRKDLILSATMFVGAPFEDSQYFASLYSWLMDQKDDSVTPELFLFKSIELHKGDIWKAITSCWNILIMGRLDPDRNFSERAKKFADIRGDGHLLQQYHWKGRPGYQWTSKADNFSAWYHFWGCFLWSFFRGSTFVLMPLPPELLLAPLVLLEEVVYASIDHARKFQFKAFADMPNRLRIDMEGLMAGARLARHIKRGCRGELSHLAGE